MQVCKSRYDIATVGRLFPSSSSDKVYKVTAFRPNEFPFCSCPSYIFSRSKQAKAEGVDQRTIPGSCKHLDQTLRDACDWQQERPDQYRFDETCPKCGGPLVDADLAKMLPDDPDASIDDLRALAAELRGEEAPPPLPKPVEYVVVVEARGTWNVHVTALTEEAAMAEALDTFAYDREPICVDQAKAVAAAPFVPTEPPKAKQPRKKAAGSAPARGRQKADPSALLKKASGT